MKIKSCPFCGGEKSVIFDDCKGLEECASFEHCMSGGSYVSVVCSVNEGGCGASSGYSETKAGAVANWNRRAGQEVLERRLEQMLRRMAVLRYREGGCPDTIFCATDGLRIKDECIPCWEGWYRELLEQEVQA